MPKRREAIGREVPHVLRDNQVCPSGNGRGKNVPVTRVRQLQRLDQRLVAGHERVHDMRIHKRPRPCELHMQFRPCRGDGARPFLMDCRRPSRSKKLCRGSPHQQIAQWRRVKDTRIAGCAKSRL